MRGTLLILAAILLALGVVEGVSYWWMHPAPAGLGEPVLVYRPGYAKELSVVSGRLSEKDSSENSQPPAPGLTTDNRQPTTDNSSSASSPSTINSQLSTSSTTLTPLPEIYASSAPMLRCTGGQVLHARLDETAGIHLAFFEWDGTDTGSVLEAFRHMPEACMGSIGMKLIEKAPVRTYVVGGQGAADASRSESLKVESQKSESKTTRQLFSSSSDLRPSDLQTFDSSSSPSTLNSQLSTSSSTLTFDHTVFREGGGVSALGPPIHAFRAVWVSGIDAADARKGLGGNEFDQLRTIRLKSARDRFRPAHARVIQGAVRGIPDPDLAWQAFENAMLKDLSFQ